MISWQKQLNMWMQKKTWQMKRLHLPGAKDIIAENVSDNAGYRTKSELTMQKGRLISTAKDPKAESVYRDVL